MKNILVILVCLIVAAPAYAGCRNTIQPTTPSSRFQSVSDGVSDAATGLVWQHCSVGQADEGCTGTATTLNWQEALQYAEQVAQDTGVAWRLPNIKELRSIVEEACYDPAINASVFPNTEPRAYWTSTTDYGDRDGGWVVHFDEGEARHHPINRADDYYVRLVRDAQ